ncbi:hypothetical protein [Saccharopolyspora tripterygii]
MLTSAFAAAHEESALDPHHATEAVHTAPPTSVDNTLSTDHDERGHEGPYCDARPHYISIAVGRSLAEMLLDLAFLYLALAAATLAIGRSIRLAGWGLFLRKWPSRPNWIPSSRAFLSLVSISRT